MKRNLVGVIAVSIAALLFAGCGGGSSAPVESSTSTTTAKTVVTTICKTPDRDVGYGVREIHLVWSDGSMTSTKERCDATK